MARIYNDFRVLNYDTPSGEITLAWYDNNFPYAGQILHRQQHRIPEDSEGNNWVREDFRAWWVQEVAYIGDVDDYQWMKDEAHATHEHIETIAKPV